MTRSNSSFDEFQSALHTASFLRKCGKNLQAIATSISLILLSLRNESFLSKVKCVAINQSQRDD